MPSSTISVTSALSEPSPKTNLAPTPVSYTHLDVYKRQVFIPSIKEVKRFSDYDSDRIAYPTEYAVDKGVYVNGDTNGSYWWLRSNGGNMYNAAVVNFSGYIFEYGFYVNSSQYGVRPAVWISLI